MRVLSSHKRRERPLPDLLPFPFTAEEGQREVRRTPSRTPKPSKFVKGEMYHSDYESDFEGKIQPKWRPSVSDTEDSERSYRKIEPQLRQAVPMKDREQSPPCPHKWESHEDIEKLSQKLKMKKSRLNAQDIKRDQLEETIESFRRIENIEYSGQQMVTEVKQVEVDRYYQSTIYIQVKKSRIFNDSV